MTSEKKISANKKITACVTPIELQCMKELKEHGVNISFLVRKAIRDAHDLIVKASV